MAKALKVALATLVIVAVGAAVAPGHVHRYKTTVTIGPEGQQRGIAVIVNIHVGGDVRSPKASCERYRTVKLFHEDETGRRVVATDISDTEGHWSARVKNAQNGDYYAVAVRKVRQNPNHRHVCRKGRSATVGVDAGAPRESD